MKLARFALLGFAALGLIALAPDEAGAGGMRGSIKDGPYGGINWSGFYVGIQGGYAWADSSHETVPPSGEWDFSGGLYGVTWGTNWQSGNWVYGFDSDYSFSEIEGDRTAVGCGGTCFTDIRNLSTSRVRLGYASGNALVYATGGLAYGSVHAGIVNGPDDKETRFGWALGAGVEWALAPNWSLKAEYLHVDLGDRHNYTAAGTANDVDVTADIARLALNYNLGPNFWGNVLGWR
jgi:outer membrane immunogenic protein